jgi:hypothetical protein
MPAIVSAKPIGTHHTFLELMAGDDWEIYATLMDGDVGPPAIIDWLLYNSANVRILDAGDYSLTVLDPIEGDVLIQVPAAITAGIGRGVYTDALRIVAGGVTNTMMRGAIYVEADPWRTTRSPGDIANSGDLIAAESPDVAVFSGPSVMMISESKLKRMIDPYRRLG